MNEYWIHVCIAKASWNLKLNVLQPSLASEVKQTINSKQPMPDPVSF